MKFQIVKVRPQGFIHCDGFDEIISSLGWSLSTLGHQVVVAENAFSQDGTNILFGAELLSLDQKLPENVVIYNLEQPSHPNIPNIQYLATDHVVWDYNKQNVAEWKRLKFNVQHVPFGFTPNLARIPRAKTQTTDVFFSGFLTERRIKLVEALRRAGLTVVALDNAYGGARDECISRAKVCVNVRHDGRTYFNPQRVSFWLANSKCVASEFSEDDKDYKYLDNAIVRFSYENAVPMIASLVRNPKWISDMEFAGYRAIIKQDYTATVAAALEHLPQPNPILARYERGCREGDMKEYLPWLRANAKGCVLEVGVRDGASTSALLLGLDKNGGHLTSLDIVDCGSLWQHPRWTFFNRSKALYIPPSEPYYDLILIDGDHSRSGVRADLENCFTWAKNGAMIAVHDTTPPKTFEQYGGDWPSVAVGEEFKKFCEERGLVNFYLPGTQGMGVLVVKK